MTRIAHAPVSTAAAPSGGVRNLDNAGVVLLGAAIAPFGAAWGGYRLGQHVAHGTAGAVLGGLLGAAAFAGTGALDVWFLKNSW